VTQHGRYYADTLTNSFSADLITKNMLMVWTYGTLCLLALAAAVWGTWRDRRERKNKRVVMPFSDAVDEEGRDELIKQRVHEGIIDNLGVKWCRAMAKEHPYVSFFCTYDDTAPSVARAFAIFFEWIVILFAEAVAYMWAFPPGICASIKDRDVCDSTSFPIDPATTACEYVIESTTSGTCSYMTPEAHGAYINKNTVQIVLLSTFICVPFLKLFEWILEKVILAPTVRGAHDDDGAPRPTATLLASPHPKVMGAMFSLRTALEELKRSSASASELVALRECAVDFIAQLDDYDARSTTSPLFALRLTETERAIKDISPEWRQKARNATWGAMLAVLDRKHEIDDAIADLDDGAWHIADKKRKRSLRTALCKVRTRLLSEWGCTLGIADGDLVKVAYSRMLAIHARAQGWAGDVAKCATSCASEEQLLIIWHLETLDRSEHMVFSQFYPTKVAEAQVKAGVKRSHKVFWVFVLFLTTLALAWWTLAVLLSVREFQGAKIVRLWWRMTMFAQFLGLLVFEPLSIFVLNVLLPAVLSPKLKAQKRWSAHEFPWKTPLVDRPTSILAEECKVMKQAIISKRIKSTRILVEAENQDQGQDQDLQSARRSSNRLFREGNEHWDSEMICETVDHSVSWRRPRWAQVLVGVFTLLLLLEENLQGVVVDELLIGFYMVLSMFTDLPKTLGAVIFQHLLVLFTLLFLCFAPWRCLPASRKISAISGFSSRLNDFHHMGSRG